MGLDFEKAKGVDIVLQDPYILPLENESVDIVVASSVFEHSELFWMLFLETLRILKPYGLFYLNVPSNGIFHRYPVDCWRFYPDSGNALVTWARRNAIPAVLLESYTSTGTKPMAGLFWNDFVAVFLKDEKYAAAYQQRILHKRQNFINGIMHGQEGFLHHTNATEDLHKLGAIQDILGR
ncbi:MAG: class I SAM-dependent methyltransferase [Azoarcus sp.]|nr:class I SAM-dependent methyltransferase [Azoarcus sp.]